MTLTEKQKKFCEEYLIDLNATQAAIRSGYSKKTANRIGSENLSKLDIQQYIQELQEEVKKRNEITIDMIVDELSTIGFFDISQCYDVNGNLKPVHELPNNAKKVISSIKIYENKLDDEVIGITREVKLYDKLSALEKLMKHLGGYQRDNEQKPVVVQQIIGMEIK